MARKIMVVDDEPDIQLFMTAALQDNGYETCGLDEDGNVTETLYSKKPDMLIIDYMMPKRSGISICKEVRSNHDFDSIPIIMISAVVSAKQSQQGEFRKLFSDFDVPLPQAILEKPVRLPELIETMEALLSEKE